ncbi:tRNA lysidine(34) synthetase TilS [Jiella pacifica]|uniref:tRNA lysidine(34) synthetase TilS n=1 Tax=Jiella pacifica TaxID=2696469 RepID=UPI0028ADACD5|nr:tRNA lysidine(34) synthetase TilS [Jiella pacifica]
MLLAVSGGPDSLALLLTASAWHRSLAAAAPQLRVATVDHRLRPEAAEEAAFVAVLAASCGLPHETLTWTPEAKPGNLSARAREGRYALLLSHARRHGLDLVLTAHHLDDDVETHVIRRRNGGDVAASAGMRTLRWLSPDAALGRPFLGIARERLADLVTASGIVAVDDPTNRDQHYDRVRIRLELAADPRRKARARANLRRCKRARDDAERAFARALVDLEETGRLRFAEDGALLSDRAAFAELSPRCAAHLLSRAVVAAAGAPRPPSGQAVRDVSTWLRQGPPRPDARTLGGAIVRIEGGEVVVMREFGRGAIAALSLGAAKALGGRFAAEMDWPVVFDGRFVVDVGPWRALPGARLVPLGLLGKGGIRLRSCPVVVDAEGRARAALAPAARRLGPGIGDLAFEPLTPHLLRRDLDLPEA